MKILQKTVTLRIRGRVQGVGYRDSMCNAARRLGCSGWVRNRADGSVEALVQGAPGAVDALLDWARRGPPAARVDAVETGTSGGSYAGFAILPTV